MADGNWFYFSDYVRWIMIISGFMPCVVGELVNGEVFLFVEIILLFPHLNKRHAIVFFSELVVYHIGK